MPPLYEVPGLYALSIAFLYMMYWAKKRIRILEKLGKLNAKQKSIRKYVLNFGLKLGNPFRTILFPFVIMFILNGFYPILGEPVLGLNWAMVIFPIMVIIQPLVEELAIRSILFGSFVTRAEEYKTKSRMKYLVIFLGGFLIQNTVFMLLHFRLNLPTFISGIMYSVFFLDGFDKRTGERNILPAWAAHSSHNLLVWLGQIGLVTTGWVWVLIL